MQCDMGKPAEQPCKFLRLQDSTWWSSNPIVFLLMPLNPTPPLYGNPLHQVGTRQMLMGLFSRNGVSVGLEWWFGMIKAKSWELLAKNSYPRQELLPLKPKLREIILEGDSQIVMNAIANHDLGPIQIQQLVTGIKSWVPKFRTQKTSFTCREGNKTAQLMAKHARQISECTIWVEDTPPIIMSHVLNDVSDLDFSLV